MEYIPSNRCLSACCSSARHRRGAPTCAPAAPPSNRCLSNCLPAQSIASVGRDPVAVPEKIFGLTLILDFFDRCHSLVSLPPPQAAVNSLPTERAETCRTTVRMRRGDYQSPVALWFSEEPSSNLVGANPCVRPWHSLQTVPFIEITVQTCNFAPLRGAVLSCFAKKGTKVRQKKGDLGEALRLCCGNTSTFHSDR